MQMAEKMPKEAMGTSGHAMSVRNAKHVVNDVQKIEMAERTSVASSCSCREVAEFANSLKASRKTNKSSAPTPSTTKAEKAANAMTHGVIFQIGGIKNQARGQTCTKPQGDSLKLTLNDAFPIKIAERLYDVIHFTIFFRPPAPQRQNISGWMSRTIAIPFGGMSNECITNLEEARKEC